MSYKTTLFTTASHHIFQKAPQKPRNLWNFWLFLNFVFRLFEFVSDLGFRHSDFCVLCLSSSILRPAASEIKWSGKPRRRLLQFLQQRWLCPST
jgi:hypothetical protein